ncbi:MAG: hypothetical protein LBP95_13695 [Deltaproteobacteria bacterium]|nr:hypothetical protein [Deltaproteobacteria bacterium]
MTLTSIGELDLLLAGGGRVAVFDVRERGAFSREHFLSSSSLPLSVLEIDVGLLAPNKNVRVVLIDGGGGEAGPAGVARGRLRELGYQNVAVLEGGLAGLKSRGRELFEGVGARSKAFGEWVAEARGTPFITPEDYNLALGSGKKILLLDVRPLSEHRMMTVPGSLSATGVDVLAKAYESLRGHDLVVVHCAGRTRSIIAAQSLVDAGLPAPVAALKNGTMAWETAGYELERGACRVAPDPGPEALALARRAALGLADRFGVRGISLREAEARLEDPGETVYFFDVRSEAEYLNGHLEGSASAPGGQLVQAADERVGVFGATIVLVDDDEVRARLAASWLVRLGWEKTFYLIGGLGGRPLVAGAPSRPPLALNLSGTAFVTPDEAGRLLAEPGSLVADFSPSSIYGNGHVAGARWLTRAALTPPAGGRAGAVRDFFNDVSKGAGPLLFTSEDGLAAALAARDLASFLPGASASVISGGNKAWAESGRALVRDGGEYLAEPHDEWRMPYMDPDASTEEREAYFQWEHGLVSQLKREGVSFKIYP